MFDHRRKLGIGRLRLITVAALLAVLAGGAVTATGRTASGPQLKVREPLASAGRAAERPRSKSVKAATLTPIGIPGHWHVVLNSVFNGSSLDGTIWRQGWFGSGITGPINAPLEAACYGPDNVTFPGDGTMHLNLTKTASTCEGETRPYTGSVVSTNPNDGRTEGGFQYRFGVLESRIYVPGQGSLISDWPTVVTLGQVWPQDGEDDILEAIAGAACFHFHSPGYAPSGHLGGCDSSLTPGWHTFASDWKPGSVTYYYDGREVGEITKGVTSAPMYIVIVNTAPRKTPWVDEADALRVSYVRVWQSN
jgi:beta-glucanase (GH16 family)